MGFFTKFFEHDEKQKEAIKASIREEINIADAITAHMKWKGRLQSYRDGTSAEKLEVNVVSQDNQCVLGKWIYGTGLNHFQGDEGFDKLRADHATFHLIAGEVIKRVQANDKPGADALINHEYAKASLEVINDLAELQSQLRAKEVNA